MQPHSAQARLGLLALAAALLGTASPATHAGERAGTAQEDSLGLWSRPAIDPLVAQGLAHLCEQIDQGESSPDEKTLDRLLQQPERLAEALASALRHGSWDVLDPASGEPTTWKVTSRREVFLRELARGLPVALLVERAKSALEEAGDPGQRRVELILLGEVARPRDVPLLIDLAVASDSLRAGDELQQALAATLRRDADGCREVEACWRSLPSLLRMNVLRALAESGRPEALSVLAARLDDQPDLTLAVLSLLGRLGSRTLAQPDARVVAALRSQLDSSQADVRREAALAAGRLEVSESVPRLVELLESPARGEREAAHWALQRISLLGLPADPGPWKLWLQSEETWWANAFPGCVDALWSRDPAWVIDALDQMARHRYRRAELAQAITSLADASAGDLTERRCYALATLRTRASLPFLRECLSSPDECVALAAATAWRATTGLPATVDGLALAREPH